MTGGSACCRGACGESPGRGWPRDTGAIVPFALAVLLVASLGAMTLAEVGVAAWRVSVLDTQHAQAYWLARGRALELVHEIAGGHSPAPVSDVVYSLGKVHAVVTEGATWGIQVTADTGLAADTVQVTYDDRQHRITAWTDANGS
jgi:hypothetical protein